MKNNEINEIMEILREIRLIALRTNNADIYSEIQDRTKCIEEILEELEERF